MKHTPPTPIFHLSDVFQDIISLIAVIFREEKEEPLWLQLVSVLNFNLQHAPSILQQLKFIFLQKHIKHVLLSQISEKYYFFSGEILWEITSTLTYKSSIL